MRNVISRIGFDRTTDRNKIEVIVLDGQKSRELLSFNLRIVKCPTCNDSFVAQLSRFMN